MLFRKKNGTLVEINKKNFINDIEYYKVIAECYGVVYDNNAKENYSIKNKTDVMDRIISLSKK